MDDLLSEFLTETSESIAVIDVQLVEFEKNPNDKNILSNIFRLVHTIKGTCGFLGLPRLESVAHSGENVLGKFRDGTLMVTPEAVTLILSCIDRIRELLDALESSGEEPAGDDSAIKAALDAMAEGRTAAVAAAAPAQKAAEAPTSAPAGGAAPTNQFGAPVAADLLAEVDAALAAGKRAATETELAAELAAEKVAEAAKAPQSDAAPPVAKASPPVKRAETPAATESKEASIALSSIRVNVDVLENLMTLVSELVLTRNALLQMVRGLEDHEFTVPLQRLSHITSDLQEGVMKTRMQPIGNAWAKLPRIVRDLSIEVGKKIELVMKGAETELDRQVLELIKDPLTHMVRNSADHGLEGVAAREAAGKPETGTILLNAYHEGGHIIIQITDDGRGLNMQRIRDKCIGNGLVTETELDNMTDQQIQQFIFKAGFSTAEKVTSVSGRGVGMDVVRTNIEKIGGTIELKSVEGKGTVFTIKIPLTLAIVSALIVACADERFAIPQISVLELVRASSKSEAKIEMISDSPVMRLRDRLLPLIPLRNLLALGGEAIDIDKDNFIVVTQIGNNTFGIIVDKVFDTEEIVVKPVSPLLRNIPFYSGNTILGDGSVIMILDPNGIASAAGQMVGEEVSADKDSSHAYGDDEKTPLLIFKAGGAEPRAIPLALIARLEEVEFKRIETTHGQRMVQYRGQLMPLIPFDPAFKFRDIGHQPILVFTDRDRSMGLVVDEIVDIVEDRLKIEIAANVPGIIGSALVAGKATDIVDAAYFLTQAYDDWFGDIMVSGKVKERVDRRALLIDDSPFFRNLLSPLLSISGWRVTAVDSGQAALAFRDKGAMFDVIISDIEMPEINGYQLAEAIRGDVRWKNVPMIALSGHLGGDAIEKGRAAGFDDYIAKNDRDALVTSLAETVSMASRR
ncbi:MAG: chemotaxis protein CheW [Proteobacteria bacterium]|nr:chemotaxis protein CheW [Pseudomonadota bacterium]